MAKMKQESTHGSANLCQYYEHCTMCLKMCHLWHAYVCEPISI